MNFKEQLQADLEGVFFNPREFGSVATLTNGIDTLTVSGIFIEADEQIDTYNEITAVQPTLIVNADDVKNVDYKYTLTINSQDYKVVEKQQNSDGTALLFLSKHR
jgi:hypothetical protein